MIESLSRGRSTIKNDFNSLIIETPSKKNLFAIIFLSVWLCGWLYGEIMVVGLIYDNLLESFFILVWVTLWTAGGLYVIISLLWLILGRETIIISSGVFTVKKHIKNFGFTKQYSIKDIRHLTLNPSPEIEIWGRSKLSLFTDKYGKIKFDYGMKTIKFADEISEAEARSIIENLKSNPNFSKENFE